MKCQIHFEEFAVCKGCDAKLNEYFEYKEYKKGDVYTNQTATNYILFFILSGKAEVTYNGESSLLFKDKEIGLIPLGASFDWKNMEDTNVIILCGTKEISPCDQYSASYLDPKWLNVKPSFISIPIRPRLSDFLDSIKNYLIDGINCPQMHCAKTRELSALFRAYYSLDELAEFFISMIKNTKEFEVFIMQNYQKMKGVKEFVNLSGMNVSTFIRKFKDHFGETPYQWMIKQKSKKILHELSTSSKSIADIMREYDFSDASHFNRYCKAFFGASPTELRNKIKKEKEARMS